MQELLRASLCNVKMRFYLVQLSFYVGHLHAPLGTYYNNEPMNMRQ